MSVFFHREIRKTFASSIFKLPLMNFILNLLKVMSRFINNNQANIFDAFFYWLLTMKSTKKDVAIKILENIIELILILFPIFESIFSQSTYMKFPLIRYGNFFSSVRLRNGDVIWITHFYLFFRSITFVLFLFVTLFESNNVMKRKSTFVLLTFETFLCFENESQVVL